MKSKSRQTEVTSRTNRMRGALNLASHPNFDRDYGPYGKNGTPAGFFVYNHLGYEVQLRFSQEPHEWTATCPHFGIQTSFPNQTPENIQEILNDWLLGHIERPVNHATHVRQLTPAVQELAQRHNIAVSLADEIILERGF